MNKRFILVSTMAAIFVAATTCAYTAEIEKSKVLVKDACPGLTSGALASAKLVALPAGIILRTGKIKLVQKDLDAEIAKAPEAVRSQLKSNQFLILENKVTRSLLQSEATDWAKKNKKPLSKNLDEQIRAYLTSITSNVIVSDDEAKVFYDGNKDMMGGATFDQSKDQLKGYLLDQKRQDAVTAHIAGLSERHLVEISKTWSMKQYAAAINNPVDKARMSGKPSLIDFGADGCQACDMMAPLLTSLEKEYAGKANVIVINVRKEQILASRFGIQSIPVQVFFDKDGKEVFRHVGFFPKEQMIAKLSEMGVK